MPQIPDRYRTAMQALGHGVHARAAGIAHALRALPVALVFVSGVANGEEPPAVPAMREHKCYMCHADNEALVGPAFVDVATGYRGDPDAAAKIATFVRRGASSGGPWHMPPHPEISPDDASAMARYILSLDPDGARPAASSANPRVERHRPHS